jgi:hypothetical protein
LAVVAVVFSVSVENVNAETKNRLGVGAQYWKAIDDIDVDDVDDDGFSYYISYQLRPASLIKFELDLEMMPDGFAGAAEDVFAPQAYLILGSSIYAALGTGIYYSDGDFADDPFFAVKAGLDLHLLPYFYLDINASYRFDDWDSISDLDDDLSTDTIMLGAAARLQF